MVHVSLILVWKINVFKFQNNQINWSYDAQTKLSSSNNRIEFSTLVGVICCIHMEIQSKCELTQFEIAANAQAPKYFFKHKLSIELKMVICFSFCWNEIKKKRAPGFLFMFINEYLTKQHASCRESPFYIYMV